jgi:hypothetical protein
MNLEPIFADKNSTVRHHSIEPNTLVVSIPETSRCWSNREQAELRSDLAAAGVQFPLTFLVAIGAEGEPVTITGKAFSWNAYRAGDVASHVVPCDTWTAMHVIDFVFEEATDAVEASKAGR